MLVMVIISALPESWSEATQILGMIKRNFKLNSPEVLAFLNVRASLLGILCTILVSLSGQWYWYIGKVQRHATKCLQGLTHLSYENRLKKLHRIPFFVDAKGVI